MDINIDPAKRFELLLTQAVYGCVWRYCCRLCSSPQDAEDLLQDALASAYRRLDQLRDASAFRSWLLCIARRTFIDRQRKSSANSRLQQSLENGHPQHTAQDSAWSIDVASHDPLAQQLKFALQALPPEPRALLSLHYLEGLTAAELAVVLKISAGAVEQRLHRARKALRERMTVPETKQDKQAVKGVGYGQK